MTLALVIGANGFMGRHIAAAMAAQRDMEIVGAGLGTPLPNLKDRWLDLDLLIGDGRLEAELRATSPELIINCSGATSGTAAELMRLNVLTTAALIEGVARSGIRTRLIHLGSAAEYGPGPVGRPVDETTTPRPASAYGNAKLASTQLVAAWAAGGRDAVVLRVFNALGPGMPASTLAGAALRRLSDAVATSAPRIEMGPLGTIRDFVDVRDIASAIVAACGAGSLKAPVVNVGSGTGHSARELVEALAKQVGFSGEISEGAAGSPRSSDVLWQVADVTLAERLLRWRAVHELQSTAESMTATARPSRM